MEKRLNAQIEQLKKAVDNFLTSLSIDISEYNAVAADSIKSGQVQKFEFCMEAYWKTLKRYLLEEHGEDLKTPKSVIKKAFELELFSYENYELLIQMLGWRNELSHIYKQERFEEIRRLIIDHKDVWRLLLKAIE